MRDTARSAAQSIVTAIDLPIGAGFYLLAGWTGVLLACAWFVLAAVAQVGWFVWKETR